MTADRVDYVIVRENVEGLYAGRHGGSRVEGEVAADTSIVTRAGTRRIAETAFALAERRAAAGRTGPPLVTCVDKSNVLASYAFFREEASEVAAQHLGVSFETVYVDAAALHLVQRPSTFDVLVTENMFGDILSDLRRRRGCARPVPGCPWLSARHRGPGGRKPCRHDSLRGDEARLAREGRDNVAALRASGWIEQAVAAALRDGSGLTSDLGGSAGTAQAGDAVVRAVEAVAAVA